LFSISRVAEGKRIIQPDAVADDFWREAGWWYKEDFVVMEENYLTNCNFCHPFLNLTNWSLV
jgi:hypothetical protein